MLGQGVKSPQITSLLYENKTLSDATSIANAFNDYFSNAAKKLTNKLHEVQTIFENILQLHANPPYTCMLLHQINLAIS